MATAAATASFRVAAGVSFASSTVLRMGSRNSVPFPRRSPAPVALSASAPAPAAPAANPKYHNAKADAGDEDHVNGEELLRRFTREAARAGVAEEVRRRRRHEDARDRRKRKARAAARRYRRRHFKGPYPLDDDEHASSKEGMAHSKRPLLCKLSLLTAVRRTHSVPVTGVNVENLGTAKMQIIYLDAVAEQDMDSG